MIKRYFVLSLFASLLLSCQLWGQGAPFVLVTDLTGHQILSVNTTSLAVTPIATQANSNLEDIVYGPEGTALLTGNKVYVCDPTADKIYRFGLSFTSGQPSAAVLEATVYSGSGSLHNAQCGRFNSSGDFLVTSKTSGLGVWKFPGLAGSTCTTACPTPVQLFSGTGSEGDLTQANNLEESVAARFLADLFHDLSRLCEIAISIAALTCFT